ncbi:MAG: hypothetical protein KJ808_00860 [Acidobacteria bacterium]|nr:hypothetical protein [Acidobacteriota bacterium]MBU4307280.1 hypothetical protein [Acidobacteriota bacterium]MBU4405653.1 hypothetical protein [Acidobacteriota bacterium]MCG2812473.1 hypothetical protein [Candidatus Aminicenantes bacterium]
MNNDFLYLHSDAFFGGIFILQLNALVAALSEKGQHIGDLVVSSLAVRKVKIPRT